MSLTKVSFSMINKISINIVDYGADPTGATDSSAAINAAISAMPNPSTLFFPYGTYLLNSEIAVPYSAATGSGKDFYFDSCQLLAGSNNMNLIHWSDSFGSTNGRVKFLANGKTGVTCFRLTPVLENANTTVVNQNYNRFMALAEYNGADEGIVLMPGVQISGTASGCWYNVFGPSVFTSQKRCIWFKDNGSSNIVSSGSNSNTFYSPTMNGSINTGIQIDAGGGNMFYSAQFENIGTGTSPNTVPTGFKVAAAMVNTGDNPNNMFYSPHWENCTRDAEINNPLVQMMFADMDFAKKSGSATLQTYIPVANNASQQQILGGLRSLATLEKVRIDNNGNVLFGGTNAFTASANELVILNDRQIAAVNSTNTGLIAMVRLTATNQATFGSGSAPLYLSSTQWSSPALVTVGAADSGGTGFKVLRIPN